MKYIYNNLYISNNEMIFYIYLAFMIIIMILTIIFVKKELKNENRWITFNNG